MSLTPERVRELLREDFRRRIEETGRADARAVCSSVISDAFAESEAFDKEAFIEYVVEREFQSERRRRVSGVRVVETVRTDAGERFATTMLQMSLFEASRDIDRRERLIEGSREELRKRHLIFQEAVRRASERGLDADSTRLGDVLSEQDVERYMAAAA